MTDCNNALNLNNKYVKALDRRAKTLRKQAMKIEDFQIQVHKPFRYRYTNLSDTCTQTFQIHVHKPFRYMDTNL